MYLSWRVFCVMVAVQAFSSFPSLLIYKLLILKISNWKWSATTYISTIISTVTTTVIACQPLFRDQVTEAVHTYASRSTHTYASRTYFYHYHLLTLRFAGYEEWKKNSTNSLTPRTSQASFESAWNWQRHLFVFGHWKERYGLYRCFGPYPK